MREWLRFVSNEQREASVQEARQLFLSLAVHGSSKVVRRSKSNKGTDGEVPRVRGACESPAAARQPGSLEP